MGWTSKTCCCCLSVYQGTMILGCFTLLNLLSEIEEFSPLRMAVNAIAAIAFVLMVFKDSEFNRKLFFITYMISSIMMWCLGIYKAFDKIEEEEPWKKACADMKAKGTMDKNFAANTEECHENMRNIIHVAITVVFVLVAFINIHFYSVVYTHWKNFSGQKE